MRVGKRNRYVWIVREKTYGDFAEVEPMTETIWHGWVHIRPISGKEIEVANAMQSIASHTVEMDFPFVQIKPQDMIKMKPRFTGETPRELNIVSVMNIDESDRELKLLCAETVHAS